MELSDDEEERLLDLNIIKKYMNIDFAFMKTYSNDDHNEECNCKICGYFYDLLGRSSQAGPTDNRL